MAEIRQDVLDGYRFLHTRLEQKLEEKNIKLDKQRIVTYGGSAGGTILLNLASFRGAVSH
jgi:alpha-beta hydrolase superfamily lysophospholipase